MTTRDARSQELCHLGVMFLDGVHPDAGPAFRAWLDGRIARLASESRPVDQLLALLADFDAISESYPWLPGEKRWLGEESR